MRAEATAKDMPLLTELEISVNGKFYKQNAPTVLVDEKIVGGIMIQFDYSLVIEATKEPDFLSFYSPELEGFTGVGHSAEDCVYKARTGMAEHVRLLKEQGMYVPPKTAHATITIKDEESTIAT